MWETLISNLDPEISLIVGGLATAVIYLWKRDGKRNDEYIKLLKSNIEVNKDLTAVIDKLSERVNDVIKKG